MIHIAAIGESRYFRIFDHRWKKTNIFVVVVSPTSLVDHTIEYLSGKGYAARKDMLKKLLEHYLVKREASARL